MSKIPEGAKIVRGFLNGAEVATVLGQLSALNWKDARIGSPKKELVNTQYRKSEVAWLDENQFVGHRLLGAAIAASGDASIEHCAKIQATSYKPGQFFDWHNDNRAFKHRKLSVVIELQSAPGAHLELGKDDPYIVSLEPGDLCVFPSEMLHRATAPTSGHRYSLVAWMGEDPRKRR